MYTIEIHPDAQGELAGLPRKVQRQIDRKIRALASDPRPQKAIPLKGKKNKGFWRVSSGDYRIIYQIADDILVVFVVKVGHRKDIYRAF